MGNRSLVFNILLLLVILLVACSRVTPEPVTKKETMIAEVPVAVEMSPELSMCGIETAIPEPVIIKETVIPEVLVAEEATCEPAASGAESSIPGTKVRTLRSSALDRDYRIYISLPPSYSRTASRTYPVVYLLDGNSIHELTAEISRLYQWAQELPELIIVGIGYDTEELGQIFSFRQRDMTPTKTKSHTGEASEFLAFIQKDLIPHIDANYRTDPMDRTIVGHSYGGLFSLYVLFHAPETFNRYVASSPALYWNERVIFDYEEAFAREHTDLAAKLFLSVGGLEEEQTILELEERWVSNLTEFHERLENRNYAGFTMKMAIIEDENHLSMVAIAIPKGLRAVFQ